ncbi:MAG TPA: phospho-sugar mutase [Acidimicrobiia bacterium]|jgi:phosphomannomutase|nr:phospho-sugar mutase [Acidimicrobiia bacterium]
MSTIPEDLAARTRAWIDGDPDPETRTELEQLLDDGNAEELAERMAGSLAFGTAGLRGRVEAGSNRMNRAVVIRTTAGLADYLLRRGGEGPVVVGFDARLSSRVFMEDTVGVLVAAGIPVRYFDEPVPTPIVAYAALAADARAAIVITASHNPPKDNGYKVYDANGAQIIPPVDRDIAAAIDNVGAASDVPLVDSPLSHSMVAPVDAAVFDRYLTDLAAARNIDPAGKAIRIVYSPMHGVGGRYVVSALAHFGYGNVSPVVEQFAPDGHFPTVAFPNPEEPGALDLALAQAERENADLIIANDPDTDRLAVSVVGHDGAWTPLTGNQIGVLLADYILSTTSERRPIVISSIVSSPMLESIAEAHGAFFTQTLTGFKWIWNAALDLQEAGQGRFVFGYEEALGYSVAPGVRDKDGISASVLFADLTAHAGDAGTDVMGRLEALYRRHGLWVSTQRSVVRPGTEGAAEIAAAMQRLGAGPPEALGEIPVVNVTDFRVGAGARPRYLAATPLVALDLGQKGRVLVRPSGTEPKLKIYVDLTAPLADGAIVADAERVLLDEAAALAELVVGHLGLG